MENDIARIELATAHRALASYNLNEGVNNHMTSKAISRFDETKEIILMLPFGKQWSDARPDDFLEIDQSLSMTSLTYVWIISSIYYSHSFVL